MLSTLTKILVILLSLFSIFLCGAMVSFVVNTNNYKQLYDEQKTLAYTLQQENASCARDYDEQVKATALLQSRLEDQIQMLQEQNTQLSSRLRNAERMSQEYQAQASTWRGLLTGFQQSIDKMESSLTQTQEQLASARAQGIKDQKELNQITTELYEKIVQLQNLDSDRKRLLQQKKDLESQLGRLDDIGGAPVTATVVTPIRNTARPVSPVSYGMDIRGLVSELRQGMVTLSVGSADGVQKDMIFHITRGDQFLCDVVITNVDVNKSAGVLELVQQQPRVGDTASTKL